MSDIQSPFPTDTGLGRPVAPSLTPFDFGRMVRSSIALFQANWPLVVILSLCVVTLPKLILVGTHLYFHGRLGEDDPAYDLLNRIDSVFDVGLFYVLQILLTWALVRRRAVEALSLSSLAFILIPSILLNVLATIGILFGLLLLIIPGLLLAVSWSVSSTALVAEGRSALQAMERSSGLCRGYFWPIFAAFSVTSMIVFATEMGIDAIRSALEDLWPDTHVDWVFQSFAAPWGSLPGYILPVALFFHLVELKEGASDTAIAEAFD
jgi:hypothetical protein